MAIFASNQSGMSATTGAKIVLAPFREKYVSRDWGLLPVSGMILYKSETLPEGARYSIINSYEFSSKN